MKRLDAMYKCRLCGKEYVECSTGGEKGNQQFVMGVMYRAVRQKKPEEIRAILPAQWRTTYDGLDLAGRRRFWFSVLDRVTVSAARDIRFTLAL